MITVSPLGEINTLKNSIQFWQHGLESATALATIFAFLAVIFEKWGKSKRLFGILSCAFWATTILCGIKLNTKTSALQNIYADQTNEAETSIAKLKPTVDGVERTVETLSSLVNNTLKPKVDSLNKTLTALQPKVNLLVRQVKSLNPKVNTLMSERNTIKDFHIEVSYPVVGHRMVNARILSNGYIAFRRNGPVLHCQKFDLPLYAYKRRQDNVGDNEHINHVTFNLINSITISEKPIEILDTCDILSIGLLDLEVQVKPPTHEMFKSISWMTAQPFINNSPLKKIRVETTPHYWESRIADAGFITFSLKDSHIKLSQQYAGSYNSKAGNTDQAH
ncbi:MAG TPA: hypothetical protein VHX63_07185 [Acidobacteriaceae bacterium]|jgi:hypothetical protein|nr:hypothetical protein [Acidobacteriaceae bacterium]